MEFAIILTVLAGLASGIGGMIATLVRAGNHRFLAASLGFSAGVMIYISLVELLPGAQASLAPGLGDKGAGWVAIGSFFSGILLAGIIDRLVPAQLNPHEPNIDTHLHGLPKRSLARTGLVTAIAVALHNFPEGFATFISALQDPQFGVPVAVAVGIHNIPEGIAVAVPIHQATGSRIKGNLAAWLSGLAEPFGAFVGYALLSPFITETSLGVVLAAVAGIMVFISFDELLPAAEEYGAHHLAIYGLILGMGVMAVSLLLLG